MQNQPDERVLYLSAEINNDSVGDICKQILAFNEADRKGMEKFRNYAINPIELHVQSFGGSVYDMWALIDDGDYGGVQGLPSEATPGCCH